MLDQAETQRLLDSLGTLSPEEMVSTIALLDELDARKRKLICQNDFLAFIAAVDPAYKFGKHLKRLGSLLMQVEEGAKDRIAVSMAPRFGKSQAISIYFPAWYIGKHPDHKLIIASHTADLAVDMARKVRNLMQSAEYKAIFPGVAIAADAKAAGKWNTTKGGEVFATGVGGALAGRGGNLCLGGNTIVQIDGAEVALEKAQPGQRILTAFGWQTITKKVLTIHKFKVKINNIDASLEHPFLTATGWVPAGGLKVGDRIKTLTFWSQLWITVNSLLKSLREKRGRG